MEGRTIPPESVNLEFESADQQDDSAVFVRRNR